MPDSFRSRFALVPCLILMGIFLLGYHDFQIPRTEEWNQSLYTKEVVLNTTAQRNLAGLESHQQRLLGDDCLSSELSDDILIIVKTGATEARDKVPLQLRTALRCVPNILVLSDLDDNIEGIELFDALDQIDPSIMEDNPDFDLYRIQQEFRHVENIPKVLKNLQVEGHPERAAWVLDKYKFFHVFRKAWVYNPDMAWYLFLEADTYLFWSTLLAWLETQDHTKEVFAGNINLINDLTFAHGGSGFILSGAAMRKVYEHPNLAADWDKKMSEECCGDYAFSQGLKAIGLEPQGAGKLFNSEAFAQLTFEEDSWCKPIMTTHHLTLEDASLFSEFEKNRKDPKSPVLFSELFSLQTIPNEAEDWDNLADEIVRHEDHTRAQCQEMCQENFECKGVRYNGDMCAMSFEKIRVGNAQEADDERRWFSTWNKTRIATWAGNQAECKDIEWPMLEEKGAMDADTEAKSDDASQTQET